MEEPPLKRARVTEGLSSVRSSSILAIGHDSNPYPESPTEEPVMAPVRIPTVDLAGEADDDKWGTGCRG